VAGRHVWGKEGGAQSAQSQRNAVPQCWSTK
jgi:hypothetical protein